MNLIFAAFASLDGYREGSNANLGRRVYDRCLVVALASARRCNPDCDVALVTNTAPPEPFARQLAEAGVQVLLCPFSRYRFEADLAWSLAYYKLCALRYLLDTADYDHLAMLDADTYTQRPFGDIWREADEAVLLYQVPHPASQEMAARISETYNALYPPRDGRPRMLTHFGGEFVAGSAARLRVFLEVCDEVFDRMQATGVRSPDGDEAILAAAAYRCQQQGRPVRAANCYVFRFWLGARFYYVSTNYRLDPLCVLHLPGSAKTRQLAVLYTYYTRHGCFPPDRRVWRLCCLPAARPPLLRSLAVRLRARLGF